MRRFDIMLENSLLLLEGKRKYSSTQINIIGDLRKRILAYGRTIDKDDLLNGGDDSKGDGLEDKPHVTVLYGTHTNDPEDVRNALFGIEPFTMTLGPVSSFRTNGDFDVLKISVRGDGLRAVNKRLSERLPNSNKYPVYRPHLTLAYLKPGRARYYVGDNEFEGEEIFVDEVAFSDVDRNQTPIKLRGWPIGEDGHWRVVNDYPGSIIDGASNGGTSDLSMFVHGRPGSHGRRKRPSRKSSGGR